MEERPKLGEPTTQSAQAVATDEQINDRAADKIQTDASINNVTSSSALFPPKENVLNKEEQKAYFEQPLAQITLKDKPESKSNLNLKEPPLPQLPQKEALAKEDPETWVRKRDFVEHCLEESNFNTIAVIQYSKNSVEGPQVRFENIKL